MTNESAENLWHEFLDQQEGFASLEEVPEAVHFCDNEEDANVCAKLVKKGIKQATSHSLLGLQYRNEKLPKIGDFKVVTDWEGNAQCIVRTTKVQLKPFFSIDKEYAIKEGEGDKSLDYWKKTHWDYYTRELEAFERLPRESMIVVCEEFEKIYE
jgi:uncharacterized protein YhfF